MSAMRYRVYAVLMVIIIIGLVRVAHASGYNIPGCSITSTIQGVYTARHCIYDEVGAGYMDILWMVDGADPSNREVCTSDPSIGDEVIHTGLAGGYPDGTPTATTGIIALWSQEYMITTAQIHQGMSGGAVLDAKSGCVLGINNAILEIAYTDEPTALVVRILKEEK